MAKNREYILTVHKSKSLPRRAYFATKTSFPWKDNRELAFHVNCSVTVVNLASAAVHVVPDNCNLAQSNFGRQCDRRLPLIHFSRKDGTERWVQPRVVFLWNYSPTSIQIQRKTLGKLRKRVDWFDDSVWLMHFIFCTIIATRETYQLKCILIILILDLPKDWCIASLLCILMLSGKPFLATSTHITFRCILVLSWRYCHVLNGMRLIRTTDWIAPGRWMQMNGDPFHKKTSFVLAIVVFTISDAARQKSEVDL